MSRSVPGYMLRAFFESAAGPDLGAGFMVGPFRWPSMARLYENLSGYFPFAVSLEHGTR